MKNFRFHSTVATALCLAAISLPLPAQAEVRPRSREIVVMTPQDLPAAARVPGEAFFLHSDDAGATYLYVEQQNGSLLLVLDVTDPGHITVNSTVNLDATDAFDDEGPLSADAELVRFHGEKGAAILDLRKVRRPILHTADAFEVPSQVEPLGDTALLASDHPRHEFAHIAQDVRIIDTANPSAVTVLATVKQVEHQLSRQDTGTTFLLGSDGLTVVRRLSVEADYKTHQMQMAGN